MSGWQAEGLGPRPGLDPGRGEAGEEHEERVEREFAVAGMPTLRVFGDTGGTLIGAGADGRVVVRARKYVRGAGADHARRLLDDFEIRMDQQGDTITVRPHVHAQERPWRDALRGRHVAVDLAIELPREAAIDAKTTSGDIALRGIRGPVSLQNVSGGLTIEDVQGPLRLRTVSGDVACLTYAGQCECSSVSGQLVFRGSRVRRADLLTVSGDVRIEGDLAAGAPHRVRTISGDVDLSLAGVAYQVEFHSMSGNLEVARGDARVARQARRDRLILVGDGAVRVEVKTTSGDLRLGRSAGPVADGGAAADAAPPADPAAGEAGPGGRGRTLRIRVTEGGAQKVNIAIPLAIARVGKVKLGGLVRGQLGRFGIDLDEVLRQVERTGRIVDVAEGSDRVEIFVD